MAKRRIAERLAEMRERLPREDVTALVPEWADLLGGDRVYLRKLTGVERDQYETDRIRLTFSPDGRSVKREVNTQNLRARLVSVVLTYDDGERVFPDAAALGASADAEVLDRLFERAEVLSGLRRREEDSLKNAPGGAGSSSPPDASAAPPANCSPPAAVPS